MIEKMLNALHLSFPFFSFGKSNNIFDKQTLVLEKGGGGDFFITYVTQWFKKQKYTDLSIIESGVFLNQPKFAITATIHNISQRDEKNCMVETYLAVIFSDGRRYEDFFTGFGKNPKSAYIQSLELARSTTLSPILSSLTEKFPNNVRKLSWEIADKEKAVYMGDWAFSGQGKAKKILLTAVEEVLPPLLSKLPLTDDSQWVKIVLLKESRKRAHVELTINGTGYNEVDEIIASFEWPETQSFYIGKCFFVINS